MEDPGKVEHDEILVAIGGELKAIGESRIGGMIVNFTGPEDPDLVGDYFAKDTEFGIHEQLPVYYDHGMNPAFGKKSIGIGTIKRMDAGLWFETELDKADEFEQHILELARKGKLRSSSGAVGHLVDRIKDGNTYKITSWPLGELSLTTQPAGGMATTVMPLKSLFPTEPDHETEQAEAVQAMTAPTVEQGEVENTGGAEPQTTAKAVEVTKHPIQEDNIMAEEAKNTSEDALKNVNEMIEKLHARLDATEAKAAEPVQEVKSVVETGAAPTIIRNIGNSQKAAFGHWLRTGDVGGVKHLITGENPTGPIVEIKASNATDMNIGTSADGGATTTDDMFGTIIRRRDEASIASQLGVTSFTGTGTTLDVPIDNEGDSEFVSTAEAAQYDQDAPAIGQLVLTKTKYSKRTLISNELLGDSSADVMNYIMDRVALGYAKTENELLINAVKSGGTQFKALAGASAIAVDELEDVVYNDDNAFYLDDSGSVAWVMKPSTLNAIAKLDDANTRRYVTNTQDTPGPLGYRAVLSNKCDTIATGNKPVLFGNWRYAAKFEDPTLQFLRDPFTRADYGQVRLLWYFRTAFGITQSAALGYAENA